MKVVFVTGKLAEPLLRDTVASLPARFEAEIAVLGISVAALMTTDWIARFLKVQGNPELILLPGHTQGEVAVLEKQFGVRTEKGPKDLRQIPGHFGLAAPLDYGAHDIEILAEINDAARLELPEVLRRARRFADEGADIIDVGCGRGVAFPGLARVVAALRAEGHRVSIDSFDRDLVREAVKAGAELVLSVNASNLELAREVGVPVVVIPDSPGNLDSLYRSLETLESWGIPHLADPVLDPIGFGAAESLHRYHALRQRFPKVEVLMGVANLTELTEADSTGLTALLIGYCQELGIRHVLTTAEIPWARGAVREVDVARRLMHYAVTKKALPRRVDGRLLVARDASVAVYSESELRAMQKQITDLDYRVFVDGERIHVFNAERFVSGTEITEIFAGLDVQEASHAFYLGKELERARIALLLGKTYLQESELRWGYLTPESDAAPGSRESRLRSARERADRRRAATRRRERDA
jgi:dihydropteroate synthase